MENKHPPVQRARCPCFKARMDYKGSSYIQCNGHNYRYPDSGTRESQYRTCCCGGYEQCQLYRERRKNHDNAGSNKP